MWLTLSLVSALLLGGYDVLKKLSLRGNAVLPVLFTAAVFGALLFVPLLIAAELSPHALPLLHMPRMTWEQHALTLLKSTIVAASWVLSYYAMRYLPITIVSPIRATSPLLTLLGAVTLLGEALTAVQWVGVAVTVAFFWLFSRAGRLENISFLRNKWILCLYGGTILSAISGLYDKYLLGHLMLPKNTMQAWFSIYIPVVLLPFLLLKWWPVRRESRFVFRWTIPLIGLTLGVADFVYFYALAEPDSLVAIVSALRRCSVVVPFFVGALFLGEQHVWRKLLILCGMLAGVAMIVLSS